MGLSRQLDWGAALNFLPQMAQFKTYETSLKHKDTHDFPTLKRKARDAVLKSLKRGHPAITWSPLSAKMKAGPPPHPVCRGLIVGYNEEEETYTIRHPWVRKTYTVRYDAIGPAEHNTWFNIKVFDQHSTADENLTHLTALRNGVAFAHGTRYDEKSKKRSRPQGFAAYELWREAFKSENVPLRAAHHHANMLEAKRSSAAKYMRELVKLLPEAAEPLETAATHYDHELEALTPLHDLCKTASKRKSITADERDMAQQLIGEALKADRQAIASIETAITILESQ